VTTEMDHPNGLAFSRDEKFLFVSDTAASHNPQVRAVGVDGDMCA
jgi:sugar lactone lactonase YvrE